MRTVAALLISALLLAGYQYQLSKTTDSPHEFEATKTVLLSELPDGIHSEFVLHNEDREPKTLSLKGTSCHCVSVSVNGRDLLSSESIEVPGNEDCLIEMTVRPNSKPGEVSQEALLQFGSKLIRFRQRANILSDIVLDESVVELSGKSTSIRIGARYRTKAPELKANVKGDLVKVVSIESGDIQSDEEIKTQFWNVLIERTGKGQKHQIGREQINLILSGAKQSRFVSVVIPSESGFDAPDVLRFGSVSVGESFERQVVIGLPKDLDQKNALKPFVSSPFELVDRKADGASLHCKVRFRPTLEEDFRGSLTVEYGQSAPLEIPLIGRGVDQLSER